MQISIHAPAKGATRSQRNFRQYFTDFNPRSREGSDSMSTKQQRGYLISIHAPAKGATKKNPPRCNHHGFQSTLPRRERQNCDSFWYDAGYFNPRSREGSDNILDYHRAGFSISIHAPAKGATANMHNFLL